MFKYHLWALLLATILDFIFGRIYSLWNPFDSIKRWVKFLDRALLGDEIILLEPDKQRSLGWWMIILVLTPVFAFTAFFTMLGYDIAPWVGVVIEGFFSYLCIEAHYLYNEAQGIAADFYGREIRADEAELTENTVTHLANEAGDSVLSPLFVMFLFGPVGGFLYRSIDIMDAQVGHKTYRYEFFGYPVARLNTIVDYLPGRFAGSFTAFAAHYTFGDFNWKNARYINLRDRSKAIGAFAGALGLQLKDKTIGDEDKIPEAKDIKRAACLLRNDFLLFQLILVILIVIL